MNKNNRICIALYSSQSNSIYMGSFNSRNITGRQELALYPFLWSQRGFPGDSDSKKSTCNTEDPGSIPGSGGPPGGGHDNPLQCSCLENSMDRVAWRATVHEVAKRHNGATNTYTHMDSEWLTHLVSGGARTHTEV